MDRKQAEALIDDAEEVVPYARASLQYAQELVETCLEADIPALIVRVEDDHRMDVLVRAEDIEQVSAVLGAEWRALAEREGTYDMSQATLMSEGAEGDESDGDLPCPACGTAAPLVDGACSDCGIQLE